MLVDCNGQALRQPWRSIYQEGHYHTCVNTPGSRRKLLWWWWSIIFNLSCGCVCVGLAVLWICMMVVACCACHVSGIPCVLHAIRSGCSDKLFSPHLTSSRVYNAMFLIIYIYIKLHEYPRRKNYTKITNVSCFNTLSRNDNFLFSCLETRKRLESVFFLRGYLLLTESRVSDSCNIKHVLYSVYYLFPPPAKLFF